ncbi:O-antigen polymerase [Staphylococcus equorum]|uniref:O-antigen polymerase n=1 Tax=Staphylococcus equorum TaxID=246432 RepID=UPI002DBEDCEB|nr:O-antigen polymerase [Staphylococcus equorum]MEB7673056.1 hypothetical protein [Staphylococcus equorum]
MYKSTKLTTIVTIFTVITTLINTIYLFLFREELVDGYQNLFLLPLTYLFTYMLFIRPIFKNKGISFFLMIYTLVSYTRYNILSYLVYKSQWYGGISKFPPTSDQFSGAILLMSYELIVYSIAIYIFHKYLIKDVIKRKIKHKMKFQKSNIVYLCFILITMIFVTLNPNSLSFFSFISINENYKNLETLGVFSLVTIVLLSVSRILIYFIFIKWIVINLKPKYYLMSFFLVVFVSLLNSMIFIGTNRASFLLNFLATIIIIIYLYRKTAISFVILMFSILPTLLGSLLSYRQTTTITQGANKIVDLTDTLQVYLGGVYNVALSLDILSPNSNIFYLIIDVMRSAIGPNILLKNINIVNSVNLYNERIFQSTLVSQIIPMIGQGKLYLGYILAPLLGVIFIFIATYFTKIIVEKNRFELIFVFTLISGRLGFVMAQNGNIFMNELTFYLPLFLIIYYLNNKVVAKNE